MSVISSEQIARARLEGRALGREAVDRIFKPAARAYIDNPEVRQGENGAANVALLTSSVAKRQAELFAGGMAADTVEEYLGELVAAAHSTVRVYLRQLDTAFTPYTGNRAERRRARSGRA